MATPAAAATTTTSTTIGPTELITQIGVPFKRVQNGDTVKIAYVHANGKFDLLLHGPLVDNTQAEDTDTLLIRLKVYYLTSDITNLKLIPRELQLDQLIVVVDKESNYVERGLFKGFTKSYVPLPLVYLVDSGKIVLAPTPFIFGPIQMASKLTCRVTNCFLDGIGQKRKPDEMLTFMDSMKETAEELFHVLEINEKDPALEERKGIPLVTLRVKGSRVYTLNTMLVKHFDHVDRIRRS